MADYLRDIAITALRDREQMGDVYAFGLIDEAAKRAGWQFGREAVIQSFCDTFDEFLLANAREKSMAALDEEIGWIT